MKQKGFIFLIAFLIGLGCASTPKKRSFGETVDDTLIANRLKTKYLKDKIVEGSKVQVESWKGIVSLKGELKTKEQIYRAIEIAELLAGVKEVKSYLVLEEFTRKSPHSFQKPKRSDSIEERDLSSKL